MSELSNKTIWMYWEQGWNKTPHLVKQCKHSWEMLNPDYTIMALDAYSVGNYIDTQSVINANRSDISIATVSDLIRIALLAKHGGAWVDATVMCSSPLDSWLPGHFTSGFFAFRNPGRDRLMSSWFIAAEPNNILAAKLYEEFHSFLSQNAFPNQYNILGKLIRSSRKWRWNRNIESTTKWITEFDPKTLNTYPYFIFHYTFNKMILENETCRQIWDSAKPYEAKMPHEIQRLSRSFCKTKKAKNFILSRQSPVHKLNRRRNANSKYWTAVLDTFEKTNGQHQVNEPKYGAIIKN